MHSFRVTRMALAATFALAVGTAHAAPVFFTGTDNSASGVVHPSRAPFQAKQRFLSALTPSSVRAEDFESFAAPSDPEELDLKINGKLRQTKRDDLSGEVRNVERPVPPGGGPPEFPGRFNTTPVAPGAAGKWWDTPLDFEISLGSLVSAFGFYATDFGDFAGTLRIDLLNGAARVREGLIVDGFSTGNGGLLFYGLVDDEVLFDRIVFDLTQTGTDPDSFDRVGFDDIVVGLRAVTDPGDPGDPGSSVPEPGSLALAGLALLGAGLARRPRRRA